MSPFRGIRSLAAASAAFLLSAAALTADALPAVAAPPGIATTPAVSDLEFSPDDRLAYAASESEPTVSVVDTASETVIAQIPVPAPVRAMALSPDGTRLYLATVCDWSIPDMGVLVIDTATRSVSTTRMRTLCPTYDIVVAGDGRTLFAGSTRLDRLDVATGALLQSDPVPAGHIDSLALTRDGRQLYSQAHSEHRGVYKGSANWTITRFETAGMAASGSGNVYSYEARGLAVVPDGTRVLTADWDGWMEFSFITLFSGSHRVHAIEGIAQNLTGAIASAHDGTEVVVGAGSRVAVVALTSGRLLRTVETAMGVTGLWTSHDGKTVYAGSAGGPGLVRIPVGVSSPAPTVDRIAGADRYATAIELSRLAFPTGADAVYLASGQNFPDALSAAPAAAMQRAALLLTPPGELRDDVRAEIERLAPRTIVALGGPEIMSDALRARLGRIAPVVWLRGADRYATSRAIAQYAWPGRAPSVHLADGRSFPDAVGSAAGAGSLRGPLILMPGDLQYQTPAYYEVDGELGRLRPLVTYVLGGQPTISDLTYNTISGSNLERTERLWGMDRYATSWYANGRAISAADHVYLATGTNFPDALAGAAVAGAGGSPLFIVPPNCVPRTVLADIAHLGATRVTLLGGTPSLSAAVEALTPCA